MTRKLHIPHIDYNDSFQSLVIEKPALHWEFDAKRQLWVALNEDFERELEVRPPLPYPRIEAGTEVESYLENIEDAELPSYGMFLMQAGAAALGYFEDGEVVFHKAIKKYMVRAKRGKSQINYLNTRGKSKAGSRIRLANTHRFIEEIIEYLTQWEEYDPPEMWLYSCPASLWGLLFAADPPPPFEKNDPRVKKLPFDVNKPDFAELQRINELACMAEIRWY